MLTGDDIIHPYIAGDRGSVMFAPLILKTFLILIKEETSIGSIADHLRRSSKKLLDTASTDRHFIDLSQASGWKQSTCRRVLNGSREEYIFPIGSKCLGQLVGRIKSQPTCRTAGSRHHIHVLTAVTVTGKGYRLTVRRPYRNRLIRITGCKAYSLTAFNSYFIYIAFICKRDRATVGRQLYVTHPQRSDC